MFPESKSLDIQGTKVIGRDPACDCELPGTEASRRHASVTMDAPFISLKDLGSRNGLFVNGCRWTEGQVSPGDVIRCGEWVGVITAESDSDGFREVAPGWFGGAALASVMAQVRRVPDELPIVVEGETGTGKECAARAIHLFSRRTGEFVAVNCATLPEHLVESQLFGHKRGAFTGADKSSIGYFRAAHGGTLFLDEIQELSPSVQPKLLRAIERQEIVPVGETLPMPVDVRIVTASQMPLIELVRAGRFRADLFARLDGLTASLPALRSRREDVLPLFVEFLRQQNSSSAQRLDSRLVETLCLYDWPLNVRELLLLAKRLVAIHGSEPLLRREHLPARLIEQVGGTTNEGVVSEPAMGSSKRAWRPAEDKSEFARLEEALRAQQGNVSRAAESIGITRARAYRLIAANQKRGG